MSSELLPGNMLTVDELNKAVSASAILRAMRKVNLDYEPSDKEKLQEVFTHPELLARAIGMIVSGSTDAEVGKDLGITPYSAAIIRENEFVKAVSAEVAIENIDRLKAGMRGLSDKAIATFDRVLSPDSKASDKVKVAAANSVMRMILGMESLIVNKSGSQNNVNSLQVNNFNSMTPEIQEAYDRTMSDIQSISPVAKTIYDKFGGDEDDE